MAWNQPGDDKNRPAPRGAPDNSSLDEMLRRWQQRVQRLWRPGSGGGTAAAALLVLIAAVWLASGYYQIDSAERGVVQRFGRYVSTEQPGHGWHWPWPIETLTKVNVEAVNGLDSKALMLTADQSLIEISWSVQYRISEPLQYLFQLDEPEASLRAASETVIRELVAAQGIQSLLNGDARARVTSTGREQIQQLLDGYRAGIRLTAVNLTDLQLPDAVVASQRDAAKAAEDHQRAIADAQAYVNDILPKAQSAAQRQIADAQVYATQTVAAAQGEAQRFSQLAAAYEQAPDVTRSRLYIETMETILSRSRKIVIDGKSGGGSMIYLPLDKLVDAVRSAAPAAAAPLSNAGTGGSSSTGTGTGTGTGIGSTASASGSAATDPDDARSRERTER